jgi:hypothetical protein
MNLTIRAVRGGKVGRRALAVVLLSSLAATGCYRSVELGAVAPVPGMRITAELSPVGAEDMAQLIGPEAVGVEGRVIRWDATETELALLRVDHRGTSVQWNQERVVFPESALRRVRERTLDTPRTAAFVGGVAAVSTVLAIAFLRSLGFGSDDGSNGGSDPPH